MSYFRFIAEEMSADGNSAAFTDEPTWIIDPIDGTTNFVHGYVLIEKFSTNFILLLYALLTQQISCGVDGFERFL